MRSYKKTHHLSLLLIPLIIWQLKLSMALDKGLSNQMSNRQTVLNELFRSCDAIILPPEINGSVTEVEIALFINNFGDISEEKMELSLDIMTFQKWVDPRLAFQANTTENLSRAELSAEMANKIWRPSVFFVNEKAGKTEDGVDTNQLAHVYKNGTVIYSKRISVTLSCHMLLYHYPHDHQNCPITISTYGYTKDVVNFKWRALQPIRFHPRIHLSRFMFNKTPATEICDIQYSTVGEFTCLETFIHLKREFGYYLLQIYLPTMLIVVVSWLSFYLPVEAVPARVSVGLITVLTMTTESGKARDSLPHVSYVTALDYWMTVSLVFVFAAMLEYAIISVVHRRSRQLFPSQIPQNIDSSVSSIQKTQGGQNGMKINLTGSRFILITDKRIDVFCRFGFPIVYLIFQAIYWAIFLSRNSPFSLKYTSRF